MVNNAGIIKRVPILDMPTEEFSQVIDIDLISPFIVSKKVAPDMIKNGGGKIINICSLMSTYGRNSVSAYASAKGGLKMLTRSMCVEWGMHNIQVNGIGSGYIKTAKTEEFAQKDHPFNKLIMTRTPARRWGVVDDLTGTALLLASDAGNFINGQLIFVDGGITANFGYLEGGLLPVGLCTPDGFSVDRDHFTICQVYQVAYPLPETGFKLFTVNR